MKRGDHEVTEFISLSAALKAVEPIVRDPTLLRVGREIKQFGRMKPRELLGNVLLALVANPLTAMEWIRVSTDPFNADGLISNDATGQTWLMEHVFVPGPTPKHPQGRQEDVGELVLEQIALKVAKDDDYCRGKTLFILCNEAGPWVPDDVVKKLPSPGTFNAIWAGNRTGKTTTGEFVYHLVRLDWVQRYAPRWRLTIAPDFGSWTVVKEQ